MRRAFLIVSAIALAGCERGCLTRWATEHQGGVRPSPTVRGREIDLGGVDCSDGLLRCRDGNVEASRVGHLPARCGQRAKGEKQESDCACPWDDVARCATGCADENETVTSVGDVDAGLVQMCRPTTPVARPVLPEDHAEIEVCPERGIACRDGVVSVCDSASSPSRPAAHCIFGCATTVAVEIDEGDGPVANLDGLAAILCRRGSVPPK